MLSISKKKSISPFLNNPKFLLLKNKNYWEKSKTNVHNLRKKSNFSNKKLKNKKLMIKK